MARSTKLLIAGAAVAVAAIGTAGGAVAVAGGGDDDAPITGEALDSATAAALAHTGGGRVTETEAGDDDSYYEVEVTLDDGTQVDVQLDESFTVVSSSPDDDDDGDDDTDDDGPITGEALESATAAALAHTGGGRVTETEAGDDDSYYEVEVTLDDGTQVDVQLDESFTVVSSSPDDDDDGDDDDGPDDRDDDRDDAEDD